MISSTAFGRRGAKRARGVPLEHFFANASLSRRAAERVVAAAVEDGRLERAAAEQLGANLHAPGVLEVLLEGASESKRRGQGDVVSVSRNLFIPLTNLCRDRCAYCTFAKLPDSAEAKTYTLDEVAEVVRGGVAQRAASRRSSASATSPRSPTAPTASGWRSGAWRPRPSTSSRPAASPSRAACCPTPTPASSRADEMAQLRRWNASMGLMLESTSQRLRQRGQAHYYAPDKDPARRIRMHEEAGELRDSLHQRDPARHRRERRRARRHAARHPRSRRPLRSHPGGDRPALPPQARHADARRRRRSPTTRSPAGSRWRA